MQTDIVETGGAIQPTEVGGFIKQAIDSKLEPAALEKLYDLYEREKKSNAAASFNRALAKFQDECPKILKTKCSKRSVSDKGFGYNYADLTDVLDAVTPYLKTSGFSRTWGLKVVGGKEYVACTLRHADGHVDDSAMLPYTPDTGGSMNSIQRIGSGMSYLEKYTLIMALGISIAGMDDDGNRAESAPPETINDEQFATLNDMVMQADNDLRWSSKAGRDKFFKVFTGKESGGKVSDVLADKADEAIETLKGILSRKAGAK